MERRRMKRRRAGGSWLVAEPPEKLSDCNKAFVEKVRRMNPLTGKCVGVKKKQKKTPTFPPGVMSVSVATGKSLLKYSHGE